MLFVLTRLHVEGAKFIQGETTAFPIEHLTLEDNAGSKMIKDGMGVKQAFLKELTLNISFEG